jgi:outer membrane usher protein FimD/PapC
VEGETIIHKQTIEVDEDDCFQASINNGEYVWPIGQYRIDIYVNNEKIKSLEFEVTQVTKQENK